MSLNHSPEMHQNIIARIPAVTGRELREWFMRLESGPPFSRCEERAHWLSDEHGLSHGYASAIVVVFFALIVALAGALLRLRQSTHWNDGGDSK